MKRILLISYNFSPEPTGIGKYNGEMIEWLVKKGYDCNVITAYPYYPYWKVQEPFFKKDSFILQKRVSMSLLVEN
jgi:colanic acid biosynthesis glycosyl transferase WcaI